ncbi:hypothetical protein FQN50_000952 [Emmonsiellopsis sp. PD_5]|nr:hypothetical protein FQN50_000952 [Emmonsiellopsis sp. PD_5]
MDNDSKACDQSDSIFIVWMRHLDKYKSHELAARLAFQHLRREPVDATHLSQGSFNRCYRVKFRKGSDVVVRFPALGRSMFRREKLEDEIAVMAYIASHTSIPVPRVLASGTSVVGPYMIMDFVEGTPLSDYLRASQDPNVPSALNLDLDTDTLRRAYCAMAEILLELSKCRFSAIGGIACQDSGEFSVGKRAMTFNMNELVGLANFPPKQLAQRSFRDAPSYLTSLADTHLLHLETQRNDAVTDEDDCRKKYLARCLFRQVCSTFSTTYANGPFPLFCDDLRPANVLVDGDLRVRGVIDWEFSYAAPAEFTHCTPWWLLLARPDTWDGGIDNFLTHYKSRQNIFLEILRQVEEGQQLERGLVPHAPRLSERMAASLEDGRFWILLAATYSFSFDEIYWKFIHPKYYGPDNSVEGALKFLSEEEQNRMEPFVKAKIQQMQEGGLDPHRTLEEMTNA